MIQAIKSELRFRCESRGRFGWSGTASAGDVRAGAEIVVVAQAVAAKMDFMHATMNHRNFNPTQVAAATSAFRLRFR